MLSLAISDTATAITEEPWRAVRPRGLYSKKWPRLPPKGDDIAQVIGPSRYPIHEYAFMAEQQDPAEDIGQPVVAVEEKADDIRKRLMATVSFRSLESERAIISILKKLGWDTTHAAYYQDPSTGKTRETDVIGRATWRRQHAVGTLRTYLNLVFEAKSNAGYHLIFAPETIAALKIHEHWIGSDDGTRKAILDRLESIGVAPEQLRAIDKGLDEAASPNEGVRLIHGLRAQPPAAPFYTSAYRETNFGNEKELDGSVLWRAGQVLFSAVTSYKQWVFDNEMSDTTAFTNEAIKAGDSPMVEAVKWLTGFVCDYYIFHPIVVIESPMWAVKGSDLEALEWCRFIQTEFGGTYDWWFDIVHSQHLEKYLNGLSEYYGDFYKET